MDLAAAIKYFRTARGITKQAVADDTKLSISYVRAMENGDSIPSFLKLLAIANALKTPLSEIVKYMEDQEKN